MSALESGTPSRTITVTGLGFIQYDNNTHVAAYGGNAYVNSWGQTWLKRAPTDGADRTVASTDVPVAGTSGTSISLVANGSGVADGREGIWIQPSTRNTLEEWGGSGADWGATGRVRYGVVGNEDFTMLPEYLWFSNSSMITLRAVSAAAPAPAGNVDTISLAGAEDLTNDMDTLYAVTNAGIVTEYKHEAEKGVAVGYLRFGVARNGNTHFLAAGIAASWLRFAPARMAVAAGWRRWGIARKVETLVGWRRWGIAEAEAWVGYLRFGVARNGNTHFLAAGIAASWLRFAPARMAVAAGWRRWGIARKVETLVGWRRWGIAEAEAWVGYLRFGVARNGNTHFLAAGIAASWLRFAPARMAVAAGWRRWGIARKVETLVGWRRWGIAEAEAQSGWNRHGLVTRMIDSIGWLRHAPARAEAKAGWLRNAPARAEAKAGWLRNAPARAEAKAGWRRFGAVEAGVEAGWRRWGIIKSMLVAGWLRHGFSRAPRFSFRNNAAGVRKRYFRI